MCLAIPAKIIEIEGKKAVADFDGIKKRIDIMFLEDAKVNDYVLVHVGFAIEKILIQIKIMQIGVELK